MNLLRSRSLFRTFATIVAFGAWLVLSNHCALAELTTKNEASHGCCAAKPPQNKSHCPEMPYGCCKSLKIAMPNTAEIPQTVVVDLLPVFIAWVDESATLATAADSLKPDNGPPPDSPTFVELVLNRSLLSHAPPVRA